MESEQPKLFVANLKSEVTENHLITYFSRYGKVTEALVIRHKGTGNSKGFGFVTFDDPAVAATVLDVGNHMILEQKIEVKKAVPKNQEKMEVNDGNTVNGSNNGGNDDKNNNDHPENNDNSVDIHGHAKFSCRKIFVGGLPPNITKEELGAFFESFGAITDVCVILNKETKRPRGFGFVTFESEETAAKVLSNQFYKLDNQNIEVKKAVPKINNGNIEINNYNNYVNMELSYGYGNPYSYGNFYWPTWCPHYHLCGLCASRGVFDPMCYSCASQYSVYNAQVAWNSLEFNGGFHKTEDETGGPS